MNDLKLIVLESCKELGEKVNSNLKDIRSSEEDYRINVDIPRFSDGEAKATIKETVRDKDVFIMCDTHNYNITYDMYGYLNRYCPDDHFQDIKRVILAMMGHAKKITVVMPFLYASRQHRKKSRESLDCANALQELKNLGVSEVITFDAHDPNVQNAVPTLAFDNLFVTNDMLEKFLADQEIDLANTLVVSPDLGATQRARYLADILGVDVGACTKRRNTSIVTNGQNPIVGFDFLGGDVTGKTAIITDDMIASGGSMIEVAEELKKRGANKVFMFATFGLFTKGIKAFNEAYEKGLFDAIYSTNLTYVPSEILNAPWYNTVDMSHYLAETIDTLNRGESLFELINRNSAARNYQNNEGMRLQREKRNIRK